MGRIRKTARIVEFKGILMVRKILCRCISSLAILLLASGAQAALLTFDSDDSSDDTADNATERAAWLTAIVETPDFSADFESGCVDGATITDLGGGLTLDRDGTVESGAGSVDGSDPVDNCALEFNNLDPTVDLVMNFAAPVNYVAFADIDHMAAIVTLTFADFSNDIIAIDATDDADNSAEFFGLYSDDKLITSIAIDISTPPGEWALDDIEWGATSQVIPVPGAVWLFTSGLGLLGWVWRRKSFQA